MALLHNAIIRGFNSIYIQAPHVERNDISSFIGYSQTWYRFVKSHHDDEEENLFTKIEELLNDKTVFAETHGEHGMSIFSNRQRSNYLCEAESFMSGLLEFDKYLSTLPHTSAFSSDELLRIMDSFREPFQHHFHHEIQTIASLSTHPSAPAQGSPEEGQAAAVFKTWGKRTVTKAGMTDVVPFFLMNLDRMAENGMWASWPPMPAPVKWGLKNIVGMWYGGYWKFASCDAFGTPRELHALEKKSKSGKSEL